MKRRFVAILALGIAVGTVLASVLDWPIIFGYGYMRHRMYSTAVHIILTSYNRQVLAGTAACWVIWLIFAIMGRLKGKARSVYKTALILIPVILLSAEADLYNRIRKLASGFDASVLSLAVSTGLTQIVISAILLGIGIFILVRLKAKRSTRRSNQPSEGFRLLCANLCNFGRLLEKQTALIIIPFVVLCGVNGIALAFDLALRSSGAHFAKNNPNIVFIMVDTLRADHLGCYGYNRNTTPNIDKLAGDGIRFSKAISQAPWTTPSVASFMSGRYLRIASPLTLSAVTPPPCNVPFLQDILKDRGYTTAAVISNPYVGKNMGMASGYDYFQGVYDGNISSPDVTTTACDLLSKVKNKRFFMFLLYLDPHTPYVLHEKYNFYPNYKGRLKTDLEVGPNETKSGRWSADDVEYAKSLYDSEIAYTDEHIGRFLDKLKQMRLYNDTLIVFIADHGDGFNEHGLMSHGTYLYDELLSVPLMIKLPGQRTGSVAQGTFSLLNLLPSILDYLHYDASHLGLQGDTVRLKGLKKVEPSTVYSSTIANSGIAVTNLECIRSSGLKYIVNTHSGYNELYDLRRDPKEQHNIADQQRDTVDHLNSMLRTMDKDIDSALNVPGERNEAWKAEDERRCTSLNDEMQRTSGKFTKQEENRLRDLGYLQ